jgi:membrane protein YqaA with SNARE-associated domain
MRSLFGPFLSYFLTPVGLTVMAALDSSIIFFLPLGIDFVVILLAARNPDMFWLYATLASAGSVIGAAGTYWVGRKVGEHGLTRFVRASRLERIRGRVAEGAAISVAALGAIPPPFPFTAFVLTSGAVGANPWTFLAALGAVRALRFGVEAALAARYGRGIIGWMDSPVFTTVVGVFIGIAAIGTVVSAIAMMRRART